MRSGPQCRFPLQRDFPAMPRAGNPFSERQVFWLPDQAIRPRLPIPYTGTVALCGESFRLQRRVCDGFTPSSLSAKHYASHTFLPVKVWEVPPPVNMGCGEGQKHEKLKRKPKKFWKKFHGNEFVNGAMRSFRRGLFAPPWAILGKKTCCAYLASP
jgi:hypothetical protein